MKKTFLFLFIVLFHIILFSSIIYVYDENNNILSIVTIEENNIKKQVLIPYKTNSKILKISLIGYNDTIINIDNDTVKIQLRQKPIPIDSVLIISKFNNPEIIEKENKISLMNTIYSLSPFVYIKRYSRTVSYSIEGSTAEQVSVAINNIPIINTFSSIIDMDLLPNALFSNIQVNKIDNSICGKNTLAGILNFQTDSINYFYINTNKDLNMNYGILYNYKNLFFNYEKFEYGNIALPNNDTLQYSSKNGKHFSLFTNMNNFNFLFLSSNIHTEDPGISGSIFNHSDLYQSLNHFHLNYKRNNYEFIYLISENYYNYISKQIMVNDYSKGINIQIGNKYKYNNFVFSFYNIFNYAKGSKIGIHNNFENVIDIKYTNSNYYINTSIKYPISFNLSIVKKKHKGKIFTQYGIKVAHRSPTFNELYWGGDMWAKGNPDLNDESMFSVFYNIFTKFYNFDISYKFGFSFLNNLIYWIPEQSIFTPQNFQKVWNLSNGAYINYSSKYLKISNYMLFSPYISDFTDYNDLYNSIINNKDIDLSNNYKIMIYRPIFSMGMNISFLYKNFELFINNEYKSKRYITTYNTQYLNEYFTISVIGLSYKYKNSIISIYSNNPLNTQYEDIRGYPIEGRTFNLNLKMEV